MSGGGDSALNGAIPELTGSELLKRIGPGAPPVFVLFYTPLCGTCKLALRMLEITAAADSSLAIYRCNLNLSPQLAERWRIESVPCLVRIHGVLEPVKLYRMSSVGELYRWLQKEKRHADK